MDGFRMLELGEEILEGDEYNLYQTGWVKVDTNDGIFEKGDKVQQAHIDNSGYRRPV